MEEKELQGLRDQAWELLDLMGEQTPTEWQETVSQLAQLLEQEPTDEELALVYAMGLLNLTIEQDLSACGDSVSKLSELFGRFDSEALALVYAMGLFNLTIEQDLSGCGDSVSKLSELFGRFDSEALALEYAKGLVNLSAKQDLSGRESSVSKLSELFDTFPKNESLALPYAQGLVNLSVEQDLSGRESSVSKLSELFDTFPKNEAIALAYANGLFNLTVDQDLSVSQASVSKLSELFDTFPTELIALEYAKGLINLSAKKDLSGRESSVSKLSELFDTFPKNEAIALAYAQGLVNLSNKQDLSGRESSVSKLSELFAKFSTESLALRYAKGLVNLIVDQDLSVSQASVSKLSELFAKFSTEAIAPAYAKGLVNLSAKQDLSGRESSVSKLSELFAEFSTESLALEYAKGLFNLTVDQDLSVSQASVSKLSELCDRFPRDEGIAFEYARGLFNLSINQDLSSFEDTVSNFEKLMKKVSQAKSDFLALLFGYLANSLSESDSNTDKTDVITDKLKEHLVAIDSSVTMAYNELFDVDIYHDIMRVVFYHHHDGDLINHCLKQFGQALKGGQYEIWVDDARDFDDQSKLPLYNLQKNIKKILHTLAVRDRAKLSKLRIGHYTSLDVLKHILVANYRDWDESSKKWKVRPEKDEAVQIIGRSRFNNANYMNDTQEGELLDQALGFTKEASSLKASNWYLMSLTTNIDDLAMWAQYGKQGEGVALVLHEDSFSVKDDISQHQLLSRQTWLDDVEKQSKEKSYRGETPYRICYLDKDGKPVEGLLEGDELVELSSYLEEIREIVEQLGEDKPLKRFADRLLEEIRYLFKSADYKYESEIRFLKYVDYRDTKQIKQTSGEFPPKLYIEAERPIKLKEIVFGPKVKEASNYVPYIRWCDKHVQVSQSQIHFR